MKDSISVEFFRKAFDLSPDAINVNRMSDGLYVSVNEGFSRITGYKKEELIGKTSLELNIWADPSDRKKLVERLLDSGKVSNLEMTFRMKNGTVRHGMMSAVSFSHGGIPHILSLTRDITERKCFENALRESEARYRQLMDLAPDGILLGDHQGRITGANSNMLKISGRTLQELIGSDITILFSEEDLKASPLRYDLVQKGVMVTIERTIYRPDGTGIPVEMHSKMMPDGTYQMFCHDISDRRSSEYEVRKLSRAVEQSPVSIVITDSSGTIEYVNSKICESTGYTKEELIGQNPRIWSSHEKSAEEYREFWKTIRSGNEWKGEFHNRHKNGSLYWERATVSPLKNEKNEITHFLGIKEDVTIQRVLEEKTRTSEKQYREIFIANPIPAFIFYEDTLEFIDINDAALLSYGFSREEFSSMTLLDIRPQDEWEKFLKMKNEFGKDEFHSTITRHMRKDKTIFPVDVTSHALPEKNGRRARLSMVIDITERVKAAEQMKLAKEKAEASDKLKTVFLNNISHEVRTPLNGIMGFVDIITQPDLSDSMKKESVLMLIESSNRLIDTITSYMDISLLTSGSMTVISKEFMPADIIKELFNNYDRSYTDKNIKLYLEIPEEYRNLKVNSDSEIFSKALCHLLDNAIKFTDEGSVHFGMRNAGDNIEFFVTDTGLGIDRENIENIFNPFYKGAHTKTAQAQGSGLGLTIAKGLIELLGGKINVTSQTGKGSAFTFSIPAWKNLLVRNMEQKADGSKQSGRPLILVAEDDETNFFYLNALLKFETNAEVIHASNGREAIDMFNSNPDINMILMDIKMPEIDGLEATRQIKKIKKQIPIIGITAYSMSGDKERVLSAGCDGYISKPINKRNLLNKMEEFIDLGKH